MADVLYEVRFSLSDGISNPEKSSNKLDDNSAITEKKPKESTDILSDKDIKKRKAKIVAQASSLIGLSMLAINTYFKYENINYQISGDYIGAMKNSNTQALINETVGLGTTIGAGFVLGGPAGGAAALAYAGYQYGLKAMNYAMETRKYVAQSQINMRETSYLQARLVRNITEVR